MSRIDAAEIARIAAELHTFADAIAADALPVPAMRHEQVDGCRLRIVPRVIHDVLCTWRVATPQDTKPVVLGCAGCGLCYLREDGAR